MKNDERFRGQEMTNRRKFERMLRSSKLAMPSWLALMLAQRAATFAAYRHTGLFYSRELEEWLRAISAKCIKNDEPITDLQDKSTLHVLSKAYESGGHTKVVERWIQSLAEVNRHSIVLTRGGSIPQVIRNSVAKTGGQVHSFKRFSSQVKRAHTLREIASQYSKVILHVHMDDIVPMLAFGKGWQGGEIVTFNHADHRFWVGASLANRLIEMRSWGKSLSETKRGRLDSQVVGIPIPSRAPLEKHYLKRDEIRAQLEIAPSAQVILTVGREWKFVSGPRTDFPETIKSLLVDEPRRLLVCVGQSKAHNASWRKLEKEFKSQVRFVPKVSREILDLYIRAADVGIDSFPMSGGTAVLDMFTLGLPVYSLECETGHFDPILNSPFYCKTEEELLSKVTESLLNPADTNFLFIEKLLSECQSLFGREIWAQVLWAAKERPIEEQPKNYASAIVDFEGLNGYLVASSPRITKLFF